MDTEDKDKEKESVHEEIGKINKIKNKIEYDLNYREDKFAKVTVKREIPVDNSVDEKYHHDEKINNEIISELFDSMRCELCFLFARLQHILVAIDDILSKTKFIRLGALPVANELNQKIIPMMEEKIEKIIGFIDCKEQDK